MTNVLLISEDYIKTNSFLDDNLYSKPLFPCIKLAQDIHLQSILGTALLNDIYNVIENGEINNDENKHYKYLIDNYIRDFLMYEVIVELIPVISVKLENIGMVMNNDEHTSNISKNERDYIETQYKYKADFYANRLRGYLCDNYNTYYSNINSTCGDIKPNLKPNESCGIFLGGIYYK